MVHEVVYLNEKKVNPKVFKTEQDMTNLWYLDNGESNHMSGNHIFFRDLDEGITGKVRFGYDSRIDIKGKGSIRFRMEGGEKKILNDVYYIPVLKSNIMSLGQATEAGCEISMKDNVLRLLDQSGQLMIQTSRSRNRLYKVVLQADTIQCLQVKTSTESSKWHARLGHVNTEIMKLVINKEIVDGIPSLMIGKEACVSCLLGNKQDNHSLIQPRIGPSILLN